MKRLDHYVEIRDESLRNARDLLRSADRLAESRKFGYASSMAILAIEEGAKSVMYHMVANRLVRFVKRRPNHITTFMEADLRQHAIKQNIVLGAIYFEIRFAPLLQLVETLEPAKSKLELRRLVHSAILAQFRYESELARPNSRVAKGIQKLFRLLGELPRTKNLGLYVDGSGGRISLPRRVKKRSYDPIRELAAEIIEGFSTFCAQEIDEADRDVILEHSQRLLRRSRVASTRSSQSQTLSQRA